MSKWCDILNDYDDEHRYMLEDCSALLANYFWAIYYRFRIQFFVDIIYVMLNSYTISRNFSLS